MSEKLRPSSIRRILVALDSSAQESSALHAAARLAASLQAELHGLFIQDMGLLRFAELPVAAEVVRDSATGRNVEPGRLERELQAQAARMSRELASAAERLNVRWSLETTRGGVETEVLAAFEQADLLIVNRKTGRALVRQDELGSTAFVATKSRRTVLLLGEQNQLDRPIVVLFEDAETGGPVLATALRLSQANRRDLIVFISAVTPESFENLKGEAANWLRERDGQVEYKWIKTPGAQMLAHSIWKAGGGMVVIAADARFLQEASLAKFMETLKLPLVLVR